MTQVRPAPPPHTRSLAACVQFEICRSRVRGPDQLRVFWMRVTIKLKISSQKPEFALLITSTSPPQHARAHANSGWSLHTAAMLRQYLQNLCRCKKRRKGTKGEGRLRGAHGRQANSTARLCRRRLFRDAQPISFLTDVMINASA